MSADNQQHRKLTERERGRMLNIYAMGPLTYRPKIDDPLFELDLLQFYDEAGDNKSVEAKHDTDFFFTKNGSVLPEWYGPDKPENDMKLPPGMTCKHCKMFGYCSRYCGAKDTWTSCDWSPSRFTEQVWHCYNLTLTDIEEVAAQADLSLTGVDLDDIIHYARKGIDRALSNRDEIIADAIKHAGSAAEHEIQGGCQR